MAQITDVVGFFFDFFEPGGTSHLLPGRPLEQTKQFNRPRGSGFVVVLNLVNGAFVQGNTLTERPLGQFLVSAGVRGENTIVCRVRLTDENMDDAIHIQVRGAVIVFM